MDGTSDSINISEILNIYFISDEDIPQEGLVAFYPFNSNANDESENTNHGNISGATLVPDRFGSPESAFYFDGVNDFIEADPLPDFENTTICYWIKVAEYHHGCVFWEGDETSCYDLESGMRIHGVLNFDVKEDISEQFLSNYCLDTDIWYFVCLICDSDNCFKKIYINCLLDNIQDQWLGTANIGYHYNLQIGRKSDQPGDASLFFHGTIDDLLIYDRVLSLTEIQTLYHLGGWDE